MRTQGRRVPNDGSLAREAQIWLPTTDNLASERILNFLRQAAASSLDPIAALRDGLGIWFGEHAETALPVPGQNDFVATPGGIAIEPLASLRRPTLWPQRPKRILGELFSSWVWRTSVAAGMPPVKFLADNPALRLVDIDRDVAPATLQRLAQRSGQSVAHLAAGTIAPNLDAADDTPAGIIEAVLLRDGRFLRRRDKGGYNSRHFNLLQYCPRCLAADEHPYFRRAWRFGTSVVCLTHGDRLLDGCWRCGKPIEILAQRQARNQPCCAECEAPLGEVRGVREVNCKQQQLLLNTLLLYIGTYVPAAGHRPYLDALKQHFRAVPNGTTRARAAFLSELHPNKVDLWFSNTRQPQHAGALRTLARGMPFEHLAEALGRRARSAAFASVRASPVGEKVGP